LWIRRAPPSIDKLHLVAGSQQEAEALLVHGAGRGVVPATSGDQPEILERLGKVPPVADTPEQRQAFLEGLMSGVQVAGVDLDVAEKVQGVRQAPAVVRGAEEISTLAHPVARSVLLALKPGHPSENRANPSLQGHIAGRPRPALAFMKELAGLVVTVAVPRERAQTEQRHRAGPCVHSVTCGPEQALEVASPLGEVVVHSPERPERSGQAQSPVNPVLGEPVQSRADVLVLLLQAGRCGDLLRAVELGAEGLREPGLPLGVSLANPLSFATRLEDSGNDACVQVAESCAVGSWAVRVRVWEVMSP
jgi:hypothetical protein